MHRVYYAFLFVALPVVMHPKVFPSRVRMAVWHLCQGVTPAVLSHPTP